VIAIIISPLRGSLEQINYPIKQSTINDKKISFRVNPHNPCHSCAIAPLNGNE